MDPSEFVGSVSHQMTCIDILLTMSPFCPAGLIPPGNFVMASQNHYHRLYVIQLFYFVVLTLANLLPFSLMGYGSALHDQSVAHITTNGVKEVTCALLTDFQQDI